MKITDERRCPGHGAKHKAALSLGAAVIISLASIARPSPVMAAEIPAGALGEALSKIQEEDQLLQFMQTKSSSIPEKLALESDNDEPDYASGPVVIFTMDGTDQPEAKESDGNTLFTLTGIDSPAQDKDDGLSAGETYIIEPDAFYEPKMTVVSVVNEPTRYQEEEPAKAAVPVISEPHSSENHITRTGGVFYGPSGKETYYNLPMDGVVRIMRRLGYTENEWPYWEREDGAKMLGDYVIVAANLQLRPRGTILPTSMGQGIVCDTGDFAINNPAQLDLALDW